MLEGNIQRRTIVVCIELLVEVCRSTRSAMTTTIVGAASYLPAWLNRCDSDSNGSESSFLTSHIRRLRALQLKKTPIHMVPCIGPYS